MTEVHTEHRDPGPAEPHRGPQDRAGDHRGARTLAELVRELREDTTNLLRAEMSLARAELGESGARVLRNIGFLAAGGLIAYLGLAFVLTAAARLISTALVDAGLSVATAAWLGPLIVGVAVAVIGIVLLQKARRTLRRTRLVPDQTAATLRDNARWIKGRTARGEMP